MPSFTQLADCRVFLKITNQLIDLCGLETGDGDVEVFLNEELCDFWEFDSQALDVPTGILGDLVVREQKRPLFLPRLSHAA